MPMDGYIRVSTVRGRSGAGYISPAIQREAIERWAAYKDIEIVQWHVDEDQSGGTHDRPGLNEAVERAVTGQTGGIVSWRIDRFSRFTEGGLRDLRRLEEAGARLAFVTEDIDTSGPMGRFVYVVMLAMSEYFLEGIKAGWVTAKARAIERGVHIGPTPLGYRRVGSAPLEIDPVYGPVVTEAFEVAAREGMAGLRRYLRQKVPDRGWRSQQVRRLIENRTYLGRVQYGTFKPNEQAHPALVTRALCEAANHGLGEYVRQREGAREYPLSGIASCGTCGGAMRGGTGGNRLRRYRCSGGCDAPATISANQLEEHVVAVLRQAFQHPGFSVGEPSSDVDERVAAVQDAERELEAFASDLTARRLLGDGYHRALQVRVDAAADARRNLDAALARVREARVVVPDELWGDLSARELRMVLGAMLETVVVDRGRGPLTGRVRVVPKGLDVGAIALPQDP
jgi:DNA invertase Pin-like site-specific DNA recombinase